MIDMIVNWLVDCWLSLLIMSVSIAWIIYNCRGIRTMLDSIRYFQRKEDDNISKCYQCGKAVCFERSNSKTQPEEYEVCSECNDHLCNDCVAWDYFRKVQEEVICFKCATLDILNSYEDEECPDCGEDIPKDVVDGQGCKNCDHVFRYFRPCDDSPEV